jgi:hypothetical protein
LQHGSYHLGDNGVAPFVATTVLHHFGDKGVAALLQQWCIPLLQHVALRCSYGSAGGACKARHRYLLR